MNNCLSLKAPLSSNSRPPNSLVGSRIVTTPLVYTPLAKERKKPAVIHELTFIIDGYRCTIRPGYPIYLTLIKPRDLRETAVAKRKFRVNRSTSNLPQLVRPFEDPPECILPPPYNPQSTALEDLFLGLPINVRWMIYDYLSVARTKPILIRSPLSSAYKESHKPLTKTHAILAVSKAIHHDVAEYFYTKSNFMIGSWRWDQEPELEPSPDGLQTFLSWTPRHYVNCITRLSILARLVVYFRKTEFTHADLMYFEAMTMVTRESFVNLRVLFVLFTEFDGVCVPDCPLDVGVKTDGWHNTLYNSFKTLLNHQSLQEIYLGVDLIGKPARYKETPAWDQLPDRNAFVLIKEMAKYATMEHGSWILYGEEDWDSLFACEEDYESYRYEPNLCPIDRKI
ncbi:uncharacterized protein EAF01_007807 [Botrytis porri]|uniref:uncharacterized protein n=1 Tax=Botrytis porri TaxID=87229 RepID=UPI00190082A6|nr:uncharacterized protein EAF01_007807 [Botrytis porri]KAF7900505.1 hypothetical protein EAF01_007807 [Botrytis porri]